jgi:sialate O-acetylesterase
MVWQRNKPVKIWGSAEVNTDGGNISLTLTDDKGTHLFDGEVIPTEGNWVCEIPPMDAGGPYTLEVSFGGEKRTFTDIMTGEVWLAGGQSNMELELQNSLNGKDVLKNIQGVNVRYYYTNKNAYMDEKFFEQEKNSGWTVASPENSAAWSAVAYYFAKALSEDLGVTVGIIGCNWGGTSASAWMSAETLESSPETVSYVNEYKEAMAGKTFEEYCRELDDYNDYVSKWQPKITEFYEKNPEGLWGDALEYAGPCRYPEPLGPKSPFRAGGLYETMVKRVMPYTLAGFIYYQGESDDHKPKCYRTLLKMLIAEWRRDWGDPKLPFIYVQLPMHINRGEEDRKNWCLIREAQMQVHEEVPFTGLAVALDCGEYGNIHPVDKRDVGKRLELQALYHVYGKITEDEAYGLIFTSADFTSDGKAVLHFSHAKDGITVKGEKALGFEIAGEDGVFYPADAKVDGSIITLSSDKVKKAAYARYNWVNYGEVNVFAANGIPLAPFRTKGCSDT